MGAFRGAFAGISSFLLASSAQAGALGRVRFDVQNVDGGGDGSFTVEVHPEWAPLGAARFEELVKVNFFKDVRFFRVIDGFMAQFGISGDPATARKWEGSNLKDDPVKTHNTRGRLTFATAGPNTRTTQMFFNFGDNSFLDGQGFSPFAEVVEGMDVVDRLYKGYGEGAPGGRGPDQGRIQRDGNKYLEQSFPKLTFIKSVTALEGGGSGGGDAASAPEVQGAYDARQPAGIAANSERGSGFPVVVFGVAVSVVLCMGYFLRSGLKRAEASEKDGGHCDLEAEEMAVAGGVTVGRKRGSTPPE